MAGFRRAFVLATAERYIVLLITLGATIVISRLLTPSEFGLSVIGSAALGIAEVIRDLGISAYLVQQRELTAEKVRTAFTVTLLLTAATVGPLFYMAEPVAQFYGLPDVKNYLLVTGISFCLGPFYSPLMALLRRDMAFGKLALIGVSAAFANAATSIILAVIGFSYMSFAWASLVSAAVLFVMCIYFRPEFFLFRPSLQEWRSVVSFGAYDSGISVLTRLWEYFPYLVLGRILNVEAVGLYQRSWTVCKLADRVLLAGVHSVALPAFSEHTREGRSLRVAYLKGVEYTTSVLWPVLLLLVLLSYPVVLVLLGRRWIEVAPLAQVMAIAQLSAFSAGLNYPTLVAVGAVRHLWLLSILQVGSSLVIMSVAALYGLYVVALSLLFTVPFNFFLSICLVRYHVGFSWHELAAAMRKSFVVAAVSTIGPLAIVAVAGSSAAVSIPLAAVAVVLAVASWSAALWLTDHPLLDEILHAGDAVIKRMPMVQGLLSRRPVRQP